MVSNSADSLKKKQSPDVLASNAVEYVQEAAHEKILLRIMGGLAIYLRSQKHQILWDSLNRSGERVFADIDFAGYSKSTLKVLEFFKKKGYYYEEDFLAIGRKRLILTSKTSQKVDVFFDKLEMNHTIDFKGRLEIDYPTIPPADLLLQKLQIVQLNEKDIKDAIVMLRAHGIADNDQDKINIKYVSKLLSDDWGFYYTSMTNLDKIKRYINSNNAITDDDRTDVTEKIQTIISELQDAPKSFSWKVREKVGAKKKWYQDVDEV